MFQHLVLYSTLLPLVSSQGVNLASLGFNSVALSILDGAANDAVFQSALLDIAQNTAPLLSIAGSYTSTGVGPVVSAFQAEAVLVSTAHRAIWTSIWNEVAVVESVAAPLPTSTPVPTTGALRTSISQTLGSTSSVSAPSTLTTSLSSARSSTSSILSSVDSISSASTPSSSSSPSSGNLDEAAKLGIGIGVGIGVPLLIAVIIAIIFLHRLIRSINGRGQGIRDGDLRPRDAVDEVEGGTAPSMTTNAMTLVQPTSEHLVLNSSGGYDAGRDYDLTSRLGGVAPSRGASTAGTTNVGTQYGSSTNGTVWERSRVVGRTGLF